MPENKYGTVYAKPILNIRAKNLPDIKSIVNISKSK